MREPSKALLAARSLSVLIRVTYKCLRLSQRVVSVRGFLFSEFWLKYAVVGVDTFLFQGLFFREDGESFNECDGISSARHHYHRNWPSVKSEPYHVNLNVTVVCVKVCHALAWIFLYFSILKPQS